MTNTNQNNSKGHLRELQLPYLEGRLTPDDESKLLAHLKTCSHCTEEIEELKSWIETLSNNKQVMCPKPWEILESLRGNDPQGEIALHLKECRTCHREAEILKAELIETEVSDILWNQLRQNLQKDVRQPDRFIFGQWLSEFREKVLPIFRTPALAIGAAAAALLVVVIFWPFKTEQSVIALSSVKWTKPKEIHSMGEPGQFPKQGFEKPKERLATVLSLNGFGEPLPTEKIDSLYQVLRPSRAINEHFDAVSPIILQKAVEEGKLRLDNRNILLQDLHDKLGIPQTLFITITKHWNRFEIEGELIETATGSVNRRMQVSNVAEAELLSSLRIAARSVLRTE